MSQEMIRRFWWGVGMVVASAFLLFIFGVIRNQTLDYWYLPYNLALAAIPLALAYWIGRIARRFDWKNWRVWTLVAVWLFFLPNSFYIVTDFIHLPETTRIDIVQDSVMLMQFSLLGYFFGFTSLYVVHRIFLRHLKPRIVWVGVMTALLLASFAIYLGRELRWNSWDIIVNPFLVIEDSLAIIFNSAAHPNGLWTMATFFVGLTALYGTIYHGTELCRKVGLK
jgi:uncharacterized membrane protein